MNLQPHRPERLPEYAQMCLEALAAQDCGRLLSLGGAFGLAHYFDYRATHDVDAWWVEPVTSQQRQKVLETLQSALAQFGDVQVRRWGDVASVELLREGQTAFSFQIANRSAQLAETLIAPWPGGIRLDALDDLVASKMNALVTRGAPRDFRDIYMLCQQGLTTMPTCWALWQARQQQAGEDQDLARARLAALTHLARIERSRPLEGISDPLQRTEAQMLRAWFKEVFLA
jgi:hypothetical protein